MDIIKAINSVCYGGGVKPTESVSDNRWRAMVAHINREYKDKNGEYRNEPQRDNK
jgi:hypothetical protein